LSRHARPLYALQVGYPLNGLTAVSGVVRLQAGNLWPSFTILDTLCRTRCLCRCHSLLIFLLLGIGPEGGEAFSSHHIWMSIPSVRPSVHTYPPDVTLRTDRRVECTSICDEMRGLCPLPALAPKGVKPSHLITYGCSFRPSVRPSVCM
jgi:hypothetical protein